jgi:hypothetical protein
MDIYLWNTSKNRQFSADTRLAFIDYKKTSAVYT